MRNLVSLWLTDAFGRLHNSSPDGGCQYWYGGEEMYQFFCVLTNLKAVLIYRVSVSESHRHILLGFLRINRQFHLLKARCFARSGFLPLINNAVKTTESNLRCLIRAFDSWAQYCSYTECFVFQVLFSWHRSQWLGQSKRRVCAVPTWPCLLNISNGYAQDLVSLGINEKRGQNKIRRDYCYAYG